MQAEFVPGGDDLLRHLRIPPGDLPDEKNACLRVPQLFENGIEGAQGETAVEGAALVRVAQAVVMTEEREPGFVINAE